MSSTFDAQAREWDADPQRRERSRVVAEAIRSRLPPGDKPRALELGCGTGALGFDLLPWVREITLADNSDGMLDVVREKICQAGAGGHMHVLRLDLEREAPPRGAYDLICTAMTLHHLEDVDGALARWHAALAPGGRLCVVDLDEEDGGFHGPEFTGHKGFARDDLRRRARAAGFTGVHFHTVFTMHKGGREYPLFLALMTCGG
jgi:SAM-dependent methyltransferase